MKMFIDKFYRMHSPYYSKQTTTTQSRSSKPSLNLNSDNNYNWDALNYKIVNIKAGVEANDTSNMAQTLTREGFYFVKGKNKYMFTEESEDGKWDRRNRVLKNIKDGVEPNDVVLCLIALVCDNKDDKFLFNDKSFDFSNILVADPTELSGFRKMDGNKYLPENYVFRSKNAGIVSSKCESFDMYKNGAHEKAQFSKIK